MVSEGHSLDLRINLLNQRLTSSPMPTLSLWQQEILYVIYFN